MRKKRIKQDNNFNYINYICLHIVLLVYSFSGVFSKLASRQEFLSPKFVMLYLGVIVILGIYAIAWQQILKHVPLTTAFCNKAVSIVWGIIWGIAFFNESITLNMFLGSLIVVIGVIIVVKSDE